MKETSGKLKRFASIFKLKSCIFSVNLIDTGIFSSYNRIDMEKRRRFIINFLYFAIILGVVFLFVKFLLPLLAPFVLGLLIAYALQRPTKFLARKTKVPRKLMAVLLVLVFYGTVGVLLALASVKAFSGVTQLIGELPSLVRLYVQPVVTQLFQELEQTVTEDGPDTFRGCQLSAGSINADAGRAGFQNIHGKYGAYLRFRLVPSNAVFETAPDGDLHILYRYGL